MPQTSQPLCPPMLTFGTWLPHCSLGVSLQLWLQGIREAFVICECILTIKGRATPHLPFLQQVLFCQASQGARSLWLSIPRECWVLRQWCSLSLSQTWSERAGTKGCRPTYKEKGRGVKKQRREEGKKRSRKVEKKRVWGRKERKRKSNVPGFISRWSLAYFPLKHLHIMGYHPDIPFWVAAKSGGESSLVDDFVCCARGPGFHPQEATLLPLLQERIAPGNKRKTLWTSLLIAPVPLIDRRGRLLMSEWLLYRRFWS